MKRIKTMSGADYEINKNGDVRRLRGDKDMSFTRDKFQYENGFLQHGFSYDDLAEGGFIHWQGIAHDTYTEPIRSSLIETITETEGE